MKKERPLVEVARQAKAHPGTTSAKDIRRLSAFIMVQAYGSKKALTMFPKPKAARDAILGEIARRKQAA